jgi:hypothetical protein
MIDTNSSDCTYVEIFTHRAGRVGAPSKWTVFLTATNTKLREVHLIASRKMNINNSFQFFSYLRAPPNTEWPITVSTRIQTTAI